MKKRNIIIITLICLFINLSGANIPRPFNKEIIPVNKSLKPQVLNKTIGNRTELSPMSTRDTLIWCHGICNCNFGGWTGDYFAEYFVPIADGTLESIIFNMSDFPEVSGGGMNLWIYSPNYNWPEISTTDIADEFNDAWLGYYDTESGPSAMGDSSEWHAGGINDIEGAVSDKIYDPLDEQLWPSKGSAFIPLEPNPDDGGLITVNLSEHDSTGSSYHFSMDDTFMVVIQFTGFPDGGDAQDYRMGFLAEPVGAEPQPGLKFYHPISFPHGRSTIDDDWGWYIRSYAWDWRCVVDYCGPFRPRIEHVEYLTTTVIQDPRAVYATIIDDEPGVTAELFYSVNGGDFISIPMTSNDDFFTAYLPGQSPGTEIKYYIKATDVSGLSSETQVYTYCIFGPTPNTNLLVVWNNDDYPWAYDLGGYTIIDLYLTPLPWLGKTYDIWDAWNWGPISKELLDNYNWVIDIGMGGPAWAGAAYGGSDIAVWLEEGTIQYPHAYALFSQDYGMISGFADTTFPAGSFEYDYLGVQTLGPQDYNYDGTVSSYTKPFKVTATNDMLVGNLKAFENDSLAMYYYPKFEIGFNNWIDVIIPTDNAIPMITDPEGNVNGVRVDSENWQTMFWALDLLCLDYWNPAYADTLESDNANSEAESAMYYSAVMVDNPLHPWYFYLFEWGGIEEESINLDFSLSPNYPNPFNPSTTISFELPKAVKTEINIYNLRGQLVETLVNKDFSAGRHQVNWNAGNLPSGIYLYQIKVYDPAKSGAGDFQKTMKCILLK